VNALLHVAFTPQGAVASYLLTFVALARVMSTHGSLTDSDFQELSHDLAWLRLQVQAVDDRLRACELELVRQRLEAEQGRLRIRTLEDFVYRLRRFLQAFLGFGPLPAEGEP